MQNNNMKIAYTRKESQYISRLLRRLGKLRLAIGKPFPAHEATPEKWFIYLQRIKESQGNWSNYLSFIACLMAKEYIHRIYGIDNWDVAEKPQGAPGLDIDLKTTTGKKIIGEIKTTIPYEEDDLGAAQWTSFENDFRKLRRSRSDIRYLFVTHPLTYKYMKRDSKYIRVPGLKVVLLPTGKQFTV